MLRNGVCNAREREDPQNGTDATTTTSTPTGKSPFPFSANPPGRIWGGGWILRDQSWLIFLTEIKNDAPCIMDKCNRFKIKSIFKDQSLLAYHYNSLIIA